MAGRQAGSDPTAALTARLRELHARAAEGDDAAKEKLAEILLPRLRRQLRQLRGAGLIDASHDAAVDAFLEVPLRMDGFVTSWEGYERMLFLAASRNVLDALRHAMRRQEWETAYLEWQRIAEDRAAIGSDPPAVLAYEQLLASLVHDPSERRAIGPVAARRARTAPAGDCAWRNSSVQGRTRSRGQAVHRSLDQKAATAPARRSPLATRLQIFSGCFYGSGRQWQSGRRYTP